MRIPLRCFPVLMLLWDMLHVVGPKSREHTVHNFIQAFSGATSGDTGRIPPSQDLVALGQEQSRGGAQCTEQKKPTNGAFNYVRRPQNCILTVCLQSRWSEKREVSVWAPKTLEPDRQWSPRLLPGRSSTGHWADWRLWPGPSGRDGEHSRTRLSKARMDPKFSKWQRFLGSLFKMN